MDAKGGNRAIAHCGASSGSRWGPAQPSPALGDAINAGYRDLEAKCLDCNTQTVAPSTSYCAARTDLGGPTMFARARVGRVLIRARS